MSELKGDIRVRVVVYIAGDGMYSIEEKWNTSMRLGRSQFVLAGLVSAVSNVMRKAFERFLERNTPHPCERCGTSTTFSRLCKECHMVKSYKERIESGAFTFGTIPAHYREAVKRELEREEE